MSMEEREKIVKIAKTWNNTPYVPGGRVKGAGTDCGMFLLEVFEEAGLIPHTVVNGYSPEHHLHSSREDYLKWVQKFAHEVTREEPLPGDILLYKIGNCISHGAIVVNYPVVIHSCLGIGVVLGDVSHSQWSSRLAAVYSVWGDE